MGVNATAIMISGLTAVLIFGFLSQGNVLEGAMRKQNSLQGIKTDEKLLKNGLKFYKKLYSVLAIIGLIMLFLGFFVIKS